MKLFQLTLCSLFLIAIPIAVIHADTKVVTPFLELEPDFIQISPMPAKVGPGGEGDIKVNFTNS
ncbi:hypothetical protein [Shimazuella kribbensis]|uniref:hypothetical protein n=1 Tax=Shimazuella kribbensis TaxID=139808 RepID=UPI00040633BC|nr:hypothetical protein [Shimazuella kribbensis]